MASFVREARPDQQQALWSKVGLQLRERAAEDRPTWVSTDGTGVHWLHVRLSYVPAHFKYGPYMHDPIRREGGGGGKGKDKGKGTGREQGTGSMMVEHELPPCRECGQAFEFSAGERAYFEERGYQPPKTCKPCRKNRQ